MVVFDVISSLCAISLVWVTSFAICRPWFFFLMTRPPPRSTPYPTLFPFTTLFRSQQKTAYEMSELQSHSEISYAVFCLKKKKKILKKRQIQKNRMTKTDEKKKK